MAKVMTFAASGAKAESSVTLDKSIFGLEVSNHELVGQAYRTYMANGRSAAASTLKRGEVRGGGKKPWRQKGTGRARAGSIRIPHWRGGGIVFGPTGNENYTLTLPKEMKRLAVRQALSLKAGAGEVVVIESFDASTGKVKATADLIAKTGLSGQLLLVVEAKDNMTIRATRNLAGLKVSSANYLNVFDIMNATSLIVTRDALDAIKSWLGSDK